MCDSLSLSFTFSINFQRLGFNKFESFFPLLPNSINQDHSSVRNGCLLHNSRTRITRNLCAFVSNGNRFNSELEFKAKEENLFDVKPVHDDANLEDFDENFTSRNDNSAASTGLNFLDSKSGGEIKKRIINRGRISEEEEKEEEDLVSLEGKDVEMEKEFEEETGRIALRKRRQIMRRSNMLAKQVISIQSALSLGFVSQLWVDTASWMVLSIEVKPNLLSGESEWFLLEDISKVGDVVLVHDESVMENEFKRVGLETLVGYKVVTPGRRSIGKIRGYTFNINSGAVESLELDSFGYSFLPSSLVSTYALLVEDVLEVISDVVVVHEDAASRIQRLTKGFLGTQNVGNSLEDLKEHYEFERSRFDRSGWNNRSYGGKKFRKSREINDDLELPMDYL